MYKISKALLPTRILFDELVSLTIVCPYCNYENSCQIHFPGLDNPDVTFLPSLSTKNYSLADLDHFKNRFEHLELVHKTNRTVLSYLNSEIPDKERLPVNLFERKCSKCNSTIVIRYDIGFGNQERGMNEKNCMVFHEMAK